MSMQQDFEQFMGRPFIPNFAFYRIWKGLHRAFATGMACRQVIQTLPDTMSRPIGDKHIFYLLRPIRFHFQLDVICIFI